MLLRVLITCMALAFHCNAFSLSSKVTSLQKSASSPLFSASTEEETPDYAQKKGYVPKWKKKATLAQASSDLGPQDKGLVGSIPITFQTGTGEDATLIQTTAMPGQQLKAVASQAGQYIQYGCGKGECGTCESLCNGKYLRPCIDAVPTDLTPDPVTGEYAPLVIQVKATKAKVVSSGKFFSFKSFILGFWNNLLGMFGFVRDRRKARKNWQERMSKEEEIKRLTEEKRRQRAAAAAAAEGA